MNISSYLYCPAILQPGFKVYRHLECAVFSEEVVTAKDVGGYRKLNKQDYKLLVERVEGSKIEIQKENEELDPDELVPVTFQGEIRSSPPGLTATLLPFQVEGTSWMRHQEVNVPEARGGILADEMGLGKTVQSITTILDNRPLLQHSKPGVKHPPSAPDLAERQAEEKLWDESFAEWKNEMEIMEVPKSLIPKARGKQQGGGARAGTLVICPVIALSQWKSEIEKFTENGTLTVGVYHGPKRSSETPRELNAQVRCCLDDVPGIGARLSQNDVSQQSQVSQLWWKVQGTCILTRSSLINFVAVLPI